VAQLVVHQRRDEYPLEQLWQKTDVSDFNEIADGAGIGDDEEH
jgi:ribosomal silencing factor RsfS